MEAQRKRGREPVQLGVVSEVIAASTDFGNVSYLAPNIHPLIKAGAEEEALHTRAFAKTASTPAGD